MPGQGALQRDAQGRCTATELVESTWLSSRTEELRGGARHSTGNTGISGTSRGGTMSEHSGVRPRNHLSAAGSSGGTSDDQPPRPPQSRRMGRSGSVASMLPELARAADAASVTLGASQLRLAAEQAVADAQQPQAPRAQAGTAAPQSQPEVRMGGWGPQQPLQGIAGGSLGARKRGSTAGVAVPEEPGAVPVDTEAPEDWSAEVRCARAAGLPLR